MESHSWDCLEELAFSMMKLAHVMFSLTDRLPTPNNRTIVNLQIGGSRLAFSSRAD